MSETSVFDLKEENVDGFVQKKVAFEYDLSKFTVNSSLGRFESAINRFSKWLVLVFVATVFIWKHDAEAMWALVGSVINSWLSFALKSILNHQRPTSASRSDPGMPSSHAQSIFYFVVFAIYLLIQHFGISTHSLTVGAVFFACGSYLTWLRVSQRLHTINQVLVGATLGSTFSTLWFWLWHSFIHKAFVSMIEVRIVLFVGSASLALAFTVHVIQNWFTDDH